MIEITEENNQNLYYNLNDCLDFCKSINETEYNELTYFHLYWYVGLEFERKQILPVKSFLATQNLKNCKLIVWSNIDLTNNEYLKPYLDKIEFRIYDPIKESIGTVLENKTHILSANDNKNWAGGDLFRVLVLHKYGGVYIDFDVVLLRDFAPLLEQEFMYKWGLEKNMINGAVMRLFKNSKLSNDLLNEICNGQVRTNSINWSSELYEKVRSYNNNWTIFPSGFFNSEWQDDKFNHGSKNIFLPFNKQNHNLYDGCFSWHWHNKWGSEIEEGSKWEIIENIINNKLNNGK